MFERLAIDLAGGAAVRSLCVAEIDGCGSPALLLGVEGGPNRLFALTPRGPVPCAADAAACPEEATTSLAAGDLDGDGAEEIFLAGRAASAAEGRTHLLDLEEGILRERLAEEQATALARLGEARACTLPADIGRPQGVLVAPRGGPAGFFTLDDGGCRDLAAGFGLAELLAASSLLFAPLFGERAVLAVFSEIGGSQLLLPDGSGMFAERRRGTGAILPGARCGAAVPSAAHDGFDLFLGAAEGPLGLFTGLDAELLTDVSPPLLAAPAQVTAALVADFDNDGADELFLCCRGEPNRLFGWREGGWRPLDVGAATLPLGAHELAAALDIDGDGCLELLLFSGTPGHGEGVVFRAPPATGHSWIRVLPLAPEGAPARGATVVLVESGRCRRRVIDCGNGAVQSEPVAHFGLGRDGRPERVEIRWPDSAYFEIVAPAPGRLHRVPHPGRRLRRDAAR